MKLWLRALAEAFSRRGAAALPALASALLLTALFPTESAHAVSFQTLQTLQGGIGFTTVLELGPEDPDPGNLGDGCIYAVNGSQGAVHRICFDQNKSVTSDAVVVDINGAGGVNNVLGITAVPLLQTHDLSRYF